MVDHKNNEVIKSDNGGYKVTIKSNLDLPSLYIGILLCSPVNGKCTGLHKMYLNFIGCSLVGG